MNETFTSAVAAIDAGDVDELRRLLDAHPSFVRERADFGEPGYFFQPYLLWFIAENPIRNGKLPANIAEVTRTIVAALEGVETRQEQLDYALGLVSSGRVPRECGVQLELIDLLVAAGARADAAMLAALAHREVAAVERLREHGTELPMANDRQLALAVAALYGQADVLASLIEQGVDVNAYAPEHFHPHATPLHHAVDSGSLEAVQVLVGAGASLETKDRLYQGTALEWADYLERNEIAAYLRSV